MEENTLDLSSFKPISEQTQTMGQDISFDISDFSPIDVNEDKAQRRGVLDDFKFFVGETAKSVARGFKYRLPYFVEEVKQTAVDIFGKERTSEELRKSGAVFGISQEEYDSRTPEQQARIDELNRKYANYDLMLDRSEKIQQKINESMSTGSLAIDPTLINRSPIPFTDNFSMTKLFSMAAENTPMLGLAAVVSGLTKMPVMGAFVSSIYDVSESYNETRKAGGSREEANAEALRNAIMLPALNVLPLDSIIKSGKPFIKVVKTGLLEGSTEVAEDVWRDSINKVGEENTKLLAENLMESFVVGFTTGGLVDSSFSLARAAQSKISIDKAKKAGVDVDALTESVGEAVIENADSISEEISKNIFSEPEGGFDDFKIDFTQQETQGGTDFVDINEDGSLALEPVETETAVENKSDVTYENNPEYIRNNSLRTKERIGSENNIKENLGILASKPVNLANELFKSTAELIDDNFGVLSTRLRNISEEAFHSLMRYEHGLLEGQVEYEKQISDFSKKYSRSLMGDFDYDSFDLSVMNSDISTAKDIATKHGFLNEYNDVIDLMNSIRKEAQDVGIDIGFVENYWHRSVKDLEGLRDFYKQDPKWNQIEKNVAQEEKKLGYKLNKAERARLVGMMISGFSSEAVTAGGGAPTRSRTILRVTPETRKFYKSSSESLAEYISHMNNAIQTRRFLGRENKEITNLRTKLKRAKSSLVDVKAKDPADVKRMKLGQLYSILEGINKEVRASNSLKAIEGLSDRADSLMDYIKTVSLMKKSSVKTSVINKISSRIDEIQSQIDSFESNLDNGIGAYVDNLVERKIIDQKQVETMIKLVRARLKSKGISNSTIALARDISLSSILGHPLNVITQFGDVFMAMIEFGMLDTLTSVKDIVRGKAKLTRKDLGLESIINAEFGSGRTREKIRDFIFKTVGFNAIDGFGKNVILNTSIRNMKKRVNNPDFVRKIKGIFGDESNRVLDDIKNDRLTYDVRYLAFLDLSSLQPITKSEMPVNWNRAGNWRIIYTLKSFTIKSIDIARRKAYDEIRKGNYKEGVQNLFRISLAYALAGASTGAVKDVLKGEEIDISDEVLNNFLQLIFYNRYTFERGKRDGYFKTWYDSLMPPVWMLADDLLRDIQSDKDLTDYRSIKNMPIVGKAFYDWFGGGS